MRTIHDVIDKIHLYNKDTEEELILRAYEFAKVAHAGQFRVSGEEYITHPVEIAYILAEMKMDNTTIVAALLHDVIEDTKYDYDDISEEFGNEVASLVDGVTKITQLVYSTKEEQQIESSRKMFLAMANDIRVVIIKLADRLHNMRTLDSMPAHKQVKKSQETLDIFAPIAHRLGMSNIKMEFEDIAFRYLNSDIYNDLVNKITLKRNESENYIEKVIGILSDKLEEQGIKAEIKGRPKHFYSIYKKMQKGKELNEIYDLIAIRVLVDSLTDCYGVLGWVHTLWKPIPGRIKDYIAMPKPNRYQSLHTTVIGHGGTPFEIQIRTYEMHQIAENGIAAHWKYKEGKKASATQGEKLQWLMQIKEFDEESEGSDDFVASVKQDLYDDEVFVFTPKGKVIELPTGATPLDFAYRIHSDIGNKCSGAIVNGKIVPLTYKLTNGDIIDIMTNSQGKGPSRDWLNVVVSSHARNKIRAYFRKADRDENIIKGKEILDRELRANKLTSQELFAAEHTDFILNRFNVASVDDMYAAFGYGGLRPGYIIQRVKDQFKEDFNLGKEDAEIVKTVKHNQKGNTVKIQGHNDLSVKFARCCMPVPGDKVIGYVTRGRGITVHRSDCVNMTNSNEKDRLIAVEWIDNSDRENFVVELLITALNRPKLISELTTILANEGIDITKIQTKLQKNGIVSMYLDIVVKSTSHLEHITKKLSNVRDVINVVRI